MKKYKIKRVPTKQGAYIRGRIDRNRRKAIIVGLLYLVSLAVISVLACGALMESALYTGGVKHFYKTLLAHDTSTAQAKVTLVNAILYALLLIVLLKIHLILRQVSPRERCMFISVLVVKKNCSLP